jgi:hypothetical protein
MTEKNTGFKNNIPKIILKQQRGSSNNKEITLLTFHICGVLSSFMPFMCVDISLLKVVPFTNISSVKIAKLQHTSFLSSIHYFSAYCSQISSTCTTMIKSLAITKFICVVWLNTGK